MGLGSTAKRVKRVAELAEQLYEQLTELRGQVVELRDTLESTDERVAGIETEVDEQRALLEAIAAENGVDVDAVLAAHRERAGDAATDDSTADGDAAADSDATADETTSTNGEAPAGDAPATDDA